MGDQEWVLVQPSSSAGADRQWVGHHREWVYQWVSEEGDTHPEWDVRMLKQWISADPSLNFWAEPLLAAHGVHTVGIFGRLKKEDMDLIISTIPMKRIEFPEDLKDKARMGAGHLNSLEELWKKCKEHAKRRGSAGWESRRRDARETARDWMLGLRGWELREHALERSTGSTVPQEGSPRDIADIERPILPAITDFAEFRGHYVGLSGQQGILHRKSTEDEFQEFLDDQLSRAFTGTL